MNFFIKKCEFLYLHHNALNTKNMILNLLATFFIFMISTEYLGIFYVRDFIYKCLQINPLKSHVILNV